MEFESSSVFTMLSPNEVIALILLTPVLLGVYLGLRAL